MRLGQRLEDLGLPVAAQIGIICATLTTAWRTPLGDHAWMTGAEKAEELAAFITELWE